MGEANEALGVLREGRVEWLRPRVRQLQHPEQGEEGGSTGAGGHPASQLMWGARDKHLIKAHPKRMLRIKPFLMIYKKSENLSLVCVMS